MDMLLVFHNYVHLSITAFMKLLICFTLSLLTVYPLFAQDSSHKIPMQADHWEVPDGRASFITHKGVPALKVTPSPELAADDR